MGQALFFVLRILKKNYLFSCTGSWLQHAVLVVALKLLVGACRLGSPTRTRPGPLALGALVLATGPPGDALVLGI